MTDVEGRLREAELEAEKVSSTVRLVIFVALATVVLFASGERGPGSGATAAIILYGLGSAAGLLLAWRRIHTLAIACLFVTFDVVLIAIQVLALGRIMGMPAFSVFALPAAALIFIVMIHASMRYRPWLVVYAAGLFIVSVELGSFILDAAGPLRPVAGGMSMSVMSPAGMSGVVNFQVLPLTLIVLGSFILFVAVRRARGLLLASIEHAARTARLLRYFSPNLAASLAESDDEHLLAGRRQPVAVLFVDIRGFTSMAETLSPDELVAFLTEYRDRLAQPVFARGGMIDKFIGDGIMVVFGSPIRGDDDAEQALKCALEILAAAERWSSERAREGKPPVLIGVGGHYGEVFAGALGSDQLLEYTVIGDTVNVAERLERLSRDVESPLVVSAAMIEAAGGGDKNVNWVRLPPQNLKGHQKPVAAFYFVSGERPA